MKVNAGTHSTSPLLLLIEPDAVERERYGGWLEQAGFGVMECPGPGRIDMTCLGVRGHRCVLVEAADMAVLDVRVLRDAYRERAAGRRLLRFYLECGKPVLLMGGTTRPKTEFNDEHVSVMRRKPTRRALLSAVRTLLEEAS
jgi:hypothetical protein